MPDAGQHPDHEAHLLLAAVHEDWPAVERGLRRQPFSAGRFLALVRECDVHPWLHARLEASGRLDLFGPDVRERLETMRRKVRADNLLLLARAEQALDLLLAAGIRPIALKGLDLLHRHYGRFDERTMDDVDLLVRPREVRRALDALARGGWGSLPADRRDHYLRSSHHLPLPSAGPVAVDFEIHWNLVQSGRYRLDVEELFERAEPLTVAGREVLRLGDHDVVAHLLLHHFTHYFDRRLKWTIDLRRLTAAPGFDWEAVSARVRAWHATAAVGMSVRHLHKVTPDWVPWGAVRALPVGAWRRLAVWPLVSSHPLELFRDTRRRWVQLYLAAVMIERPLALPGWLWHRRTRDRRPELSPLADDRHDPSGESPS